MIRLWTVSLGAAAVLAIGTAWVAASSPYLTGEAEAFRDGRELMANLELRAGDLLEEVRSGATDLHSDLDFSLDSQGELLEPRPLPAGRALRDLAERSPAGVLSPAALALADARGQLLGGQAEEALATLEEAAALRESGEEALGFRLLLEKTRALLDLERHAEAILLLEQLRGVPAETILDGSPLRLVVMHRLFEAYRDSGDPDTARRIREIQIEDLLAGALPLPVARIPVEVASLSGATASTGEGGAVLVQEALSRLELMEALQRALVRRVDESVFQTGSDEVAILSRDGTGSLYAKNELAQLLARSWQEMLPTSAAFGLLEPGGVLAHPVVGNLTVSPAFGSGWRLLLQKPETYAGLASQRTIWIWTATGILVLSLGVVGLLGARALRRRAELERLRSNFVAGVSHELRTPAASIGMLAENLAAGRVKDPDRRSEYYQALQRDAQRLQRLVANVLDVSRMERGSFRVAPEWINPSELLQRVAAEHRPRLESAGMKLALELEPALPDAMLDAGALERAFGNLIDNARKYAAEGDRVVLHGRRSQDGRLEFTVEDYGPGVPEHLAARIFEPFEQGPGSAHASGGAGLGLALVKETVEAHGGTVRLSNKPAGGACFHLRLPVQDASK